MSDDSREPPATLAVDGSAPPSVPRSSPRASPEPSAPLEHEHEHEDEDDRDELEDEGEDAASSEGRARTPDPPSAAPASSLDSVSAAASEAAKSVMPVGGKTQAAFVHKVWSMVETPALQNLISWSGDGKSFLVYSPEEFARTVLPQYFKHSNFASFLRQLNFYSWSKVNDVLGANTPTTKPDGTPVQAWEFRNPNFQRGRPDLLVRIKRKTAKSTATASPAASRRRSSVTTLASLRPTRREGAPTNEAARHAVDEERDLDAVSSSMASGSNSGSGVDFAPYTNEGPAAPIRVKDEGEYPASTRTSPPSYPRHAPPPPTYSFPHAYSPGTRAYPLPHTTTYPSYRYSYTEEPLARQVHALEGQVRGLSEALYYSQQEFMSARTTSYGVLQTLLGVVASLDPEGRKKDELQAASYALSKIAPDASPTQAYSNPFPFAYAAADLLQRTVEAAPACCSLVPPKLATAQLRPRLACRIPVAKA
ncbi:hypothetical protein Rhopal_005560-T1 [Rhodotorula paludigena]|uniref:HSF-type DNA-binding domain-containing protein n=1 Tax=Rhodotorula paludigena TaxID=86838 RepID=A0AAV5GRJ9_9BASI|nr:hypothetical protein Rhopal_005560-T1 [Rhodotorula paludigena]